MIVTRGFGAKTVITRGYGERYAVFVVVVDKKSEGSFGADVRRKIKRIRLRKDEEEILIILLLSEDLL